MEYINANDPDAKIFGKKFLVWLNATDLLYSILQVKADSI